ISPPHRYPIRGAVIAGRTPSSPASFTPTRAGSRSAERTARELADVEVDAGERLHRQLDHDPVDFAQPVEVAHGHLALDTAARAAAHTRAAPPPLVDPANRPRHRVVRRIVLARRSRDFEAQLAAGREEDPARRIGAPRLLRRQVAAELDAGGRDRGGVLVEQPALDPLERRGPA